MCHKWTFKRKNYSMCHVLISLGKKYGFYATAGANNDRLFLEVAAAVKRFWQRDALK